ncbi:melatonin receptor type 1B isoform X4 [Motacilla alba alba]|uniref:melatonin receptor type 1B isoform X4 n=1 Tax=Motacilla alba alba TaxID=1094192 RepID=UPI0018D510AF|nr:melatonin receptor type 1B isoform X4 [Motacilla alba alba]
MLENGSLRNCCDPGGRGRLGLAEREAAAAGAPRPAWVVPVLSSVLIFTTVVDILGNLLVILSVFKNRKLRNSGILVDLFIYSVKHQEKKKQAPERSLGKLGGYYMTSDLQQVYILSK